MSGQRKIFPVAFVLGLSLLGIKSEAYNVLELDGKDYDAMAELVHVQTRLCDKIELTY